MSALFALRSSYHGATSNSSSSDDEEVEKGEQDSLRLGTSKQLSLSLPSLNCAPEVAVQVLACRLFYFRLIFFSVQHENNETFRFDPKSKELMRNAKYEEMFAPVQGPSNPFKTEQQKMPKNMPVGFVEPASISNFGFETERITFESYGYARDPSENAPSTAFIGDVSAAEQSKGLTVYESGKIEGLRQKRKRLKNNDAFDLENFKGPWAPYDDEVRTSIPDPETMKKLEDILKKRKKLVKMARDEENATETSTLHSTLSDPYDYQGRSFMEAPHDVGVSLRADAAPQRCYIPKKLIHTWAGHKKGVQAIRWFPQSAHLLLSAGMDGKVKLWEVYHGRRCIRTYVGHRMAVRDICFNNAGREFLSASYDRFVKLWDTETGQCKERFTTGKVPYCIKFNPDEDKQNLFLVGTQDKKILQYDSRTAQVVQEYDRHMGAVNSVTFFSQNRRFCSTSDDKSMRIWEWDIPVDTKMIQDPGLYSMPSVTLSNGWPAKLWTIVILLPATRALLISRRICRKLARRLSNVSVDYCFMIFRYVISGDSGGKIFIWDWKTRHIQARWKAHEGVCIGVLWHPHETSKIASCGWDGVIKFWD
ncbi:pre mrna splicing factor; pre mrna processing fac tor [Trichuris trichiura]|uniref:Pre-mRNA-processing factor 17 n=1 Tax=Trichuris trichiura TaxID=36087 RepID=A0A077Z950_TRITR|nr:pre mrna splicing factor; pre mrna processing fac tor [Trichuris trichiura]